MPDDPDEILLIRIDPCRKMARFYALSIVPTLFGGYAVQRSWGRIGTAGRSRLDLFPDRPSANACKARLERSKRRRGYLQRP
ncbi:WGR domain-containing protein [Rhodobacterales bacterium]|nr:WGR domain-containing protein [Rhodobacterales bacterium]